MNNLSLKICGNPIGSGGYCDIYDLDGSHITIPNQGKEGMSGVSYYIVRITKYDVQYVYVPNVEVTSFNAGRGASLKMGISIPKHYRLKDGVSPYDVLMDVYETMKKENLSEISGMNFLQYNEKMCDKSVFEALLQKYPLEEYNKSAYRPMNGSSAALLVTDKIREFMKDPHYPELQRYSEVLVANGGAYRDRVTEQLTIPRVPQFSLYVNGKKDGGILSEKDENVVIKFHNPDPRCFESWPAVTLSMADIISERVEDGNVKVDWAEEEIYYDFPPLEPLTVPWRVEVKVNGVITNNVKHTNFTVRLSDGSTKPVNQQGEFNLTGQENLFTPKEILYNGNDDYEIANSYSNPSMHCFTVYMKKKAPMPPTPGGSNAGSGAEHHRDNDNKQKVVIVLPPKAFADNGNDHSGNIKLYPNGWRDEKDYHYKTVKFEPKKENADEVELWFSEVMLPPCLQANNGQLYISVETKKAIYNGPARIADKNKYGIGKTDKFIDLTDEGAWKFSSFWKRCGKPIFYLFTLLLAFTVGIVSGVYGERKWIEIQGPQPPMENQDSIRAAGLLAQYECLNNDSVTFNEIEELHNAIKIAGADVLEYLPEKEEMQKRAEAYYTVVVLIRNATNCDNNFTSALKKALEPAKEKNDSGLVDLPTNLDYCRYLYQKEKYDGEEKELEQAQKIFLEKKDSMEINSFTDIASITERLGSVPNTSNLPQGGTQERGRGKGNNNSKTTTTSNPDELTDDRTNELTNK